MIPMQCSKMFSPIFNSFSKYILWHFSLSFLSRSWCRKRYERAEAEYVASKMDLHKKTDTKEQLTEHLCAIIQQNELRKAERLEELMQQLQTSEEELDTARRLVEQKEKKEVVAVSKADEEKLGVEQNGEKAELCSDPDRESAVVETVVPGSADTPPRDPTPPGDV